ALAPQCQADIDGYREQVWGDVLQNGLRTWQDNKLDSAKTLLRQAAGLRPNHPRAALALGQIYAGENQIDSAATWLNHAAAVPAAAPERHARAALAAHQIQPRFAAARARGRFEHSGARRGVLGVAQGARRAARPRRSTELCARLEHAGQGGDRQAGGACRAYRRRCG